MSDRTIETAIRRLSGVNPDQVTIVECEVESVNEQARSCTATTVGGRDTITIENIRLMTTIDDGVLIIPSIGSTILIAYSTVNLPFVLLFAEVSKVLFIVGETQVQIVDGALTLNDGSLGGLIKISELITKLNNLENLVNDLVGKFNSHTHILTLTSGTGTAAPTAAPENGTLTPTQQSDLENTTIKHGI